MASSGSGLSIGSTGTQRLSQSAQSKSCPQPRHLAMSASKDSTQPAWEERSALREITHLSTPSRDAPTDIQLILDLVGEITELLWRSLVRLPVDRLATASAGAEWNAAGVPHDHAPFHTITSKLFAPFGLMQTSMPALM